MPRTKRRANPTPAPSYQPSAFHGVYHGNHRCQACGCKLDDHAMPSNPTVGDGGCPATQGYGTPAPFPTFITCPGRTNDQIDAELDAWWRKTGTKFVPKV
jgi:hypothetical protein